MDQIETELGSDTAEFSWQRFPHTGQMVKQLIDDFCKDCQFVVILDNRLSQETSFSFTTGTSVSDTGPGLIYEDEESGGLLSGEPLGIESGSMVCYIFIMVFIVIVVGMVAMVVVSRRNKKRMVAAAEKRYAMEHAPRYDEYDYSYQREEPSDWRTPASDITEASTVSFRGRRRGESLGDISGSLPSAKRDVYDEDGPEDEFWEDLMVWEDDSYEDAFDNDFEDEFIPDDDELEFEVEEEEEAPMLEEEEIVEEEDEFDEWLGDAE